MLRMLQNRLSLKKLLIQLFFSFAAAEPAKPEPKGGTTPMGGVGQVMTSLYTNYLISHNILFI